MQKLVSVTGAVTTAGERHAHALSGAPWSRPLAVDDSINSQAWVVVSHVTDDPMRTMPTTQGVIARTE
jgi:hypothetical protein